MSVQPVQFSNLEAPVASPRRPSSNGSASASPVTPQDAVVVSDEARRLSQAAPADPPALQLDFRKLRDLAFEAQSKQAAEAAQAAQAAE